MTPAQAKSVVGVLVAAFPSERVSTASVETFSRSLLDLDYADAQQATQRLILTCGRLPAIRDIREAIVSVTRSRQTSLADTRGLAEAERTPPPAGFLELGERLTGRSGPSLTERLAGLEQRPAGRCDDCHRLDRRAPRYRYGRFTVCAGCASSRLRVTMKEEA